MKFLADVNVIFPLLLSRHPQRDRALKWFDSVRTEEVALCRLARLGALRLLCTTAVMGPDVLSPENAMQAMAMLEDDERMVLVHEPDEIDAALEVLVTGKRTMPNLWTDAYLAAFARVAGLKLVTFDRGFSKFPDLDFLLLG